MPEWLVRSVCIVCRWYFRFMPIPAGKEWLWRRVLRPYLIWRPLTLDATTLAALTFRDSFPDIIHTRHYFFGVWEPGVTRVLSWHLRPGDTVIDIGANVGAHALPAARLVGPSGRVHAIEASPSIFGRLKHNIEANGLKQIIPYNVAVTDKAGPVTVFLNASNNRGATTIVPFEADRRDMAAETQVAGHPLSEVVPRDDIERARLIKIDVEGAEWLVLQGMRAIMGQLAADCIILLEATSTLEHFGVSLQDLIRFFEEFDMRTLEIANSYEPDFYISPPARVLNSRVDPNATLVDLLFARPLVLETLLARDRG